MRILYLTIGCFDKGGISRYCRYQIMALREIVGGSQLRVLSLLGPDGDSFEQPFEVTWHGQGNGAVEKVRFVVWTLREALGWRPGLLWCAHVNMAGLARMTARLCRAKVLLNTYGLEVWSGLSRDASWGLRTADRVVSDCHWTARFLEDSHLRPPGSTVVLWDCVDLDRFCPGLPPADVLALYRVPDPRTHLNLLTLGRLSRDAAYKGYARLLEAFAPLARDFPNARLIYAGKGNLVPELREKATALGLGERVCFTGPVHEDHIVDIYRCGHVFSMVGDRGEGRGEGIPLTPLEASACGLPILVGNQDGSEEAVDPGVSGFALDPFDVDGLAQTLMALFQDAERLRTMGAASRCRAETHFSYATFREKHRELLHDWYPGLRLGEELG